MPPQLSVCPMVSQCPNILLTKQNQNHFSKDCRLPVQLQRAMAAEAEAAREARAKVINTTHNLFSEVKINSIRRWSQRTGNKKLPELWRKRQKPFPRVPQRCSWDIFKWVKTYKDYIQSQQGDRQSQNLILLGINFHKTKPQEKSLLSNLKPYQRGFGGNRTTIR